MKSHSKRAFESPRSKNCRSPIASKVIAFCRERLAAYKVPKLVEFRTELPKTAGGKVLRRALVEEEKAQMAAGGVGEAPAAGA